MIGVYKYHISNGFILAAMANLNWAVFNITLWLKDELHISRNLTAVYFSFVAMSIYRSAALLVGWSATGCMIFCIKWYLYIVFTFLCQWEMDKMDYIHLTPETDWLCMDQQTDRNANRQLKRKYWFKSVKTQLLLLSLSCGQPI